MKKICLFLGVCLILLTGCNLATREVGTADKFNTTGENNGFIVSDNISSYNEASYINSSTVLNLDDIRIEMVFYDTEENASKAQDNQIDAFLKIKSTGASIKREKGSNYYKYVMISNGYYMVSSRIDNTLIFSKTLLKNKEKVETVLEDMGY